VGVNEPVRKAARVRTEVAEAPAAWVVGVVEAATASVAAAWGWVEAAVPATTKTGAGTEE
jgi:hypothetical protein